MAFVAFTIYGAFCTASGDFCIVEDLCKGWIILLFSQGMLSFFQDVYFSEIVHGCSFDVFKRTWYLVGLLELIGVERTMVCDSHIVPLTELFKIFRLQTF